MPLDADEVLMCAADPSVPVEVGGKLVSPDTLCGRLTGFPAIAVDGDHVVVPAPYPVYTRGRASATVTCLSLDVIRVGDGARMASLPLVTRTDHEHAPAMEDCCEGVDEGCDPDLCEPEFDEGAERAEALREEAVRARVDGVRKRLARSKYRALRPMPPTRRPSAAFWFTTDDDEAWVHDGKSGKQLGSARVGPLCTRHEHDCEIVSRRGWFDAERRVAIIQIVTTYDGSGSLDVGYAVLTLR